MKRTDGTEAHELQHYQALAYPIAIYTDPDGGFVAMHPDLPGCMTQGETAEEVLSMLKEARELWIATALERGYPIPEPEQDTHNGRILVRVPKSMHRRLFRTAQREGVSLNQYIVHLLAEQHALSEVQETLIEVSSASCRLERVIQGWARHAQPHFRANAAPAAVQEDDQRERRMAS